MSKQTKITRSSIGEDCQVRIDGVCNFDNSTTIPAHLSGGGMGAKVKDVFLAYACFDCHQVLDGHVKSEYSKETLKLWHLEGMVRTQQILLAKGLIEITHE